MENKEFTIGDVRTLKHLDKEMLDSYIEFFKTYKKVEKIPLDDAPEEDQMISRGFQENPKWFYKFSDKLLKIGEIFRGYPLDGELEFELTNLIYDALQEGDHLDAMTPELINFYINHILVEGRLVQIVVVDNVKKGYFLTLLKLLKKHLQKYLKKAKYYEEKYGAENLISAKEDCENGRKAGNMPFRTSDTREEDWKEFVKHDTQWSSKSFYYLIVHKLKLIRKYYDPDTGFANKDQIRSKRICREVDKALELAAPLEDESGGWSATEHIEDPIERYKTEIRLWKQANRKFFLYLANHYEDWDD